MEIKTPYEETPYDVLSDPDIGMLTPDSSKKEIEGQFGPLVQKRGMSPALRTAWDDLRSPGRRIRWDIFCSSVERDQQALQELAEEEPAFDRSADVDATPLSGPEMLVWAEATPVEQPPDFAFREVTLDLSSTYDDLERPLREVAFDV